MSVNQSWKMWSYICTASHLRWTSYIRSATPADLWARYSSRAYGNAAATRTSLSFLRISEVFTSISWTASFTMLMRISSLLLNRL